MTDHSTPPMVVTFGEVLLRLAAPANERLFQSPQLRTWWGGAEANVAMGLANLGTAVAHVTRVPANPLGDQAVRALRGEGVITSHVHRGGDRLGLYFFESGSGARALQVTYDRAGSAFATFAAEEFDWATIFRDAAWFHVSGISPALGDGPRDATRAALAAAKAAGVPTSFDLNYRPALWTGRHPQDTIAPLVQGVDVLIGNPGAIEVMLGVPTVGDAPESAEAVEATARTLADRHGHALVLVTQRTVISSSMHAWQVHALEGAQGPFISTPRHVIPLVDRVGGGDAFVAAFLHARLGGQPVARALAFGTAASILKCTIPGDANRVSARDVHVLADTLTTG